MSDRPGNAFLRSLSEATFQRLAEHLTPVDLSLGQVLFEYDQPLHTVYFPESCLLSVLTRSVSGASVETSMCGTEGAMLLLEACSGGVSWWTCLAQVDGRAWRAPAAVCRELMQSDQDFARMALKLFELQIAESRQSGLCLAIHSLEPRLARWLVESCERSAGRNPMPLTQDFMAAMLGVQRTTVTMVASQLQKDGLIHYNRGRLKIVDGEGLEKCACECHAATREHRAQLELEPPVGSTTELRLVQS